MARLIRMDGTGHTTVAAWATGDASAEASAQQVFRDQLALGYLASVTTGPGHGERVRELPLDAELVILRRPIAGG